MSHKAPPIPPEQRSFRGAKPTKTGRRDRREDTTGLQSSQPGDADVNLKSQGRYGDRRQNVDSTHFRVQDR